MTFCRRRKICCNVTWIYRVFLVQTELLIRLLMSKTPWWKSMTLLSSIQAATRPPKPNVYPLCCHNKQPPFPLHFIAFDKNWQSVFEAPERGITQVLKFCFRGSETWHNVGTKAHFYRAYKRDVASEHKVCLAGSCTWRNPRTECLLWGLLNFATIPEVLVTETVANPTVQNKSSKL